MRFVSKVGRPVYFDSTGIREICSAKIGGDVHVIEALYDETETRMLSNDLYASDADLYTYAPEAEGQFEVKKYKLKDVAEPVLRCQIVRFFLAFNF